jgi:hypothetical protein
MQKNKRLSIEAASVIVISALASFLAQMYGPAEYQWLPFATVGVTLTVGIAIIGKQYFAEADQTKNQKIKHPEMPLERRELTKDKPREELSQEDLIEYYDRMTNGGRFPTELRRSLAVPTASTKPLNEQAKDEVLRLFVETLKHSQMTVKMDGNVNLETMTPEATSIEFHLTNQTGTIPNQPPSKPKEEQKLRRPV